MPSTNVVLSASFDIRLGTKRLFYSLLHVQVYGISMKRNNSLITNLWKFSSVASRCIKISSAAETDPASLMAGSKHKMSWFKLAKKLS